MQSYYFPDIFSNIYSLVYVLFWLVVPIVLFYLFRGIKSSYKKKEFLEKIEWDILEVRVGEQNFRTPKAMKQVFSSLYEMYSNDKINLWVSFEIVGMVNGIHFYIKTPTKYRNLLESALYSQYPDIEITLAEDYVFTFGKTLPNEKYDLWGKDFKLSKSSVYPIRTYEEFEEVKDEKTVDPLSTIFEAMSKVKKDEMICIQLMVSPTGASTGNDTKKLAEKEIEKIIEDRGMKRLNKEGGEEKMSGMSSLTPGLQEVVKAIEHKSSQMIFEFTMRFMQIDKVGELDESNRTAVLGALQQFNSQSMNSLSSGSLKTSYSDWLTKLFPKYKDARNFAVKRRFFEYYSSRHFGMFNHLTDEKISFLSPEELATIFHFPRSFMKAPGIKSAYSRRGGAPSNLPVD